MLKGKKELYGFGPFRLDVSEHRLDREDGGVVAYLPEKAFQTLVVLVRNAGSLVTKEQLLSQVWPDTIVEENNLDKCIYTIRHSLGDSPTQHQYIETVRKHGYRFTASVKKIDDNAADRPVVSDPEGLATVLRALEPGPTTAPQEQYRNALEACQQVRVKYDQMTAPSTIEARELVTEALRLDPDFALAHSLSAELTTLEIIVGMKWPEPGFAEARESIARARELGDDSADFYAAAAYIDLLGDWNFAAAEEKLLKALARNTHHATANRMLGETYMFQGLHKEAAVYLDRAQVETRLHNTHILAMSRFLARDFLAVLDACDRMLELAPRHLVPALTKCWALEQMGRATEAIAGYEEILRLPYGEPALRWIGYAQALAGHRDQALDSATRLEAASRGHNVSPTHLAAIHAALGNPDKAVSYLERGLEMNDPWMLWVPTDPRYDTLRENKRFKEIKGEVLIKAKASRSADHRPVPKEIRIRPSVQQAGHIIQNEPIISTSTTESGAFVIAAKWRPAAATLPTEPAAVPKWSYARWILPAIVLTSLFLAATLAIYFFVAGAKVVEPKSIVILPFKPIDSTTRDELYEIGIADALIQRMGGLENLIVRPLGATRKYTDLDQDPVAAGKEQQVNYVLAASYQLFDGRVRVTAQLINVASGQVEDTLRSESGVSDGFAMQDAIAGQIGNALQKRFTLASNTNPVRRGTANEEAYRLYLQGMYFYSKRTLEASKAAVELLDRAVQLDPQYAHAWAGKAHAHRYAGNLGRDTDTNAEYRRSIEAINIALSLDKDLSEAHSALCENKYYYEFDFAGAEAECKKAIALDPNSSLAHEIYGRFLYHRGRFSEGIVEIKLAVDLEPASLFNQRNLGIAYYYSGRYSEAEAQLKRVIAMDQTFASAYMWLRNSLEMQQKYSEAYEWFIRGQKAVGTEERIVRLYENAYTSSGYTGMMREHAKFADSYNQYYIGGILNAQIGEKDKAFEYLENSYRRREWGMNSLLIEPQLEPLRSDPRFAELVKKVGLN